MPLSLNLSATLNVLRLLYQPSLCLPHAVVPTFDKLVIPFSLSHPENQPQSEETTDKKPNIKAVVLDKDNCFAKDHDDKVWPAYQQTWKSLVDNYPKGNILIVSNSAGTDDDVDHQQAKKLENDTGVTVLRHSTKKPGCHEEIMAYFAKVGITDPSQIVVIGDRLFTDMLMANMMGAWGIWISEGVELSQKPFVKLERMFYSRMAGYGPNYPS